MMITIGGKSNISQSFSQRIIPVNDIIDAHVQDDGAMVGRHGSGNVLGAAAVGGVLFGEVGAIVGAAYGYSKKIVNDVSLSILIDDVSTPLVSINFLEEGTSRGSKEHGDAIAFATKWEGSIRVLLRRRDKVIESR